MRAGRIPEWVQCVLIEATQAGLAGPVRIEKALQNRAFRSEADGSRTRNHRIDRHIHGSEDPLVAL